LVSLCVRVARTLGVRRPTEREKSAYPAPHLSNTESALSVVLNNEFDPVNVFPLPVKGFECIRELESAAKKCVGHVRRQNPSHT